MSPALAFPVESRGYGALSLPVTSPVRPVRNPGAVSDSPQKAAQAFVDTLPADVRDRVGQVFRDPKKRERFDQPQQTERDKPQVRTNRETRRSDNIVHVDFGQPIYTQPILTPNAALLQVQFAAQSEPERAASELSQKEYQVFHDAYLSAGAQPGGRAAALAAQIEREELEQKTLIVPPLETSINVTA